MAFDIGLILPGVIIGLIAGVVDMFFMIKDESGAAGTVISRGLGAFLPLIVFSVFSFHLEWLMNMDWAQGTLLANEILMRVALVLVVAVVTFSKSKLFKGARGSGMHESLGHTLIVAAIVGAAPYLWMLIGPMMPIWLGGS
ncbi:MAG: hypothetical protein ABIJ18_05025 [archaeon]